MDKRLGADQGSPSVGERLGDHLVAQCSEQQASALSAGERLVAYYSEHTHTCVHRACVVAGIPERNMRALPAGASTSYALHPDTLRAAIERDEAAGLIPFFLCCTVGTTSSTAVDPIEPLATIAKAHGMWVHVDAAYAGVACMCPELRHHLHGVHLADSLCANPHKWMLTGFNCSCLWTQDTRAIIAALSTRPEYLRNKVSDSQQVVDYKDWEIPLGRRFRALKLWFVLRMYGAKRIRAYFRHHISIARWLEGEIRADDRFELMAPRTVALLCFRLKPPAELGRRVATGNIGRASEGCNDWEEGDRDSKQHDMVEEKIQEEDSGRTLNMALLEAVNNTGKLFMTHTVLSGKFTLRMAIGGPNTKKTHVEDAWSTIQREASSLLQAFDS
eukprot:TRINITY_DN32507_c0_g1_i2.p1 TRINITY_DN32507_c0_g1~~TRINITY_DN32507_c0_g1_i2.p1  ORF type:complete len:424 (-),score=11.46 TRINITY_DN32507_c0_g1_i2:100-1263(-)